MATLEQVEEALGGVLLSETFIALSQALAQALPVSSSLK